MRLLVPAIALVASMVAPPAKAVVPARLPVMTAATGAASIAALDDTTLVRRTTVGSVVALADTGARWTVPAPDGCVFATAGSGVVAWDCGEGQVSSPSGANAVRHLAITDSAGTVLARVDQPRPEGASVSGLLPPARIGEQWLQSAAQDRDGLLGALLNWRTGQTWSGPTPPSGYDLDRPNVVRFFCRTVGAYGRQVIAYRPPWAIVRRRGGRGFVVRRCGVSHRLPMPRSYGATAGWLGDGWLAWTTRRRLHLVRLADRRHYATALGPRAYDDLVLTHARVYELRRDGVLRAVALPRR